MADALLTQVGLPPMLLNMQVPTFSNFVLDASTDALEYIFKANAPITINQIGVRLGAITGTTPTYRVSLQGVGTTGNPDGTVKGATNNALKTFTPSGLGWSNNTWHWLTLDETYTCARGEDLAVVIDYSSGTVDGSNNASFTSTINGGVLGFPYVIQNNATVRTRQGAVPIFGYASAGAAYGFPIQAVTNTNFNTGSTPDEYALKWTLPAGWGLTYQVVGVYMLFAMPATGKTITLTLYDTDANTALQTVTHDSDYVTGAANRPMFVPFDESSLSALSFGSTYRLSIKTSDTSNQTLYTIDMAAASDWDAWSGGQNFALATRTDGATSGGGEGNGWTTDATKRLYMALVLADWTEPTASGGVLINPGMSGGLRG